MKVFTQCVLSVQVKGAKPWSSEQSSFRFGPLIGEGAIRSVLLIVVFGYTR